MMSSLGPYLANNSFYVNQSMAIEDSCHSSMNPHSLREESEVDLQASLDAIHQEMNQRTTNIGYGVGAAVHRIVNQTFDFITDMVKGFARNLPGLYKTSVHGAVASFNHTELKALLQSNADVNEKNFFGERPFHAAIRKGNSEAVRLLLEDSKILLVEECRDEETGHKMWLRVKAKNKYSGEYFKNHASILESLKYYYDFDIHMENDKNALVCTNASTYSVSWDKFQEKCELEVKAGEDRMNIATAGLFFSLAGCIIGMSRMPACLREHAAEAPMRKRRAQFFR